MSSGGGEAMLGENIILVENTIKNYILVTHL